MKYKPEPPEQVRAAASAEETHSHHLQARIIINNSSIINHEEIIYTHLIKSIFNEGSTYFIKRMWISSNAVIKPLLVP